MARNSLRSTASTVTTYAGGSVAALFVLCGVVLFLLPEPLTSVVGIVLVFAGLASWVLGRTV